MVLTTIRLLGLLSNGKASIAITAAIPPAAFTGVLGFVMVVIYGVQRGQLRGRVAITATSAMLDIGAGILVGTLLTISLSVALFGVRNL